MTALTVTKARPAVPIAAIYDLMRNIGELIRCREDGAPLPDHAAATISQVRALSKPATRRQILDALSVLAGLFGPRGDADVIASVGASLIEAERPKVAELHIALLDLILPVPGQEPSMHNGWEGVPPKPRIFAPTVSEIIAALQQAKSDWSWRVGELEKIAQRQ